MQKIRLNAVQEDLDVKTIYNYIDNLIENYIDNINLSFWQNCLDLSNSLLNKY